MILPVAYDVFANGIQWYCLWHTMILPMAYNDFANGIQ